MLFAVCEVRVHDSLRADAAVRQHTAATEMLKEQLLSVELRVSDFHIVHFSAVHISQKQMI